MVMTGFDIWQLGDVLYQMIYWRSLGNAYLTNLSPAPNTTSIASLPGCNP